MAITTHGSQANKIETLGGDGQFEYVKQYLAQQNSYMSIYCVTAPTCRFFSTRFNSVYVFTLWTETLLQECDVNLKKI